MTAKRHSTPYETSEILPTGRGASPADSELPAVAPPPSVEEVVPHPCEAGGVANIPEELLSPSQQAADEIDHAGMDVVLPDEDRAK